MSLEAKNKAKHLTKQFKFKLNSISTCNQVSSKCNLLLLSHIYQFKHFPEP